ncbi:MAG: DUF3105 domain-containing protein [Nitrospiria bacterium]
MKQSLVKVLCLVCMLLIFDMFGADPSRPADPLTPNEGSPGKSVPTLGNKHIPSIRSPHEPYNTSPPTSGPHIHNVAKWGVYRQPLPDELQVHNLEDGGVLIQYHCESCQDLIKKLEKLGWEYLKKAKQEKKAQGSSRYGHIIVAPYLKMDSVIALTAWGKIDTLDAYDEARIRRFVEAYIGVDHHPK